MHLKANPVFTGAVMLILLICLPVYLAAQDDDPDVETDWDVLDSNLYVAGDQTFVICIGVTFPTLFLNSDGKPNPNKFNPQVGGSGSLNYNYYLSPYFFLGGEISGFFAHTIARNALFIIPLGLKIGTQFILGRFEFPITMTVGMSWHTYINKVYYGMYAKGGLSAYFRATTDWSFGIASEWAWFPEWTDDPKKRVDGNFVHLMLTARYHF